MLWKRRRVKCGLGNKKETPNKGLWEKEELKRAKEGNWHTK